MGPILATRCKGGRCRGVLAERCLITANDGSVTRYDRVERESTKGRSAPDVTITRMERIGEVEVLTNMDEKLKSLTALMKNIVQDVCPAKVIRKEEVPCMTEEIQELKRRRNRARRDMTRRRGEWTDICRELKEKTILAKRETWRKQLERIRDEKNVNRAWSVVKQMNVQGSKDHAGIMLYRGKWRTTPKAKTNAFIQEYAELSSGKSTKKTRRERERVTMKLEHTKRERERERERECVCVCVCERCKPPKKDRAKKRN